MHGDDDDKRWKRVMPPKIIYHGGSDVKWMEESLWKSARLAAGDLDGRRGGGHGH